MLLIGVIVCVDYFSKSDNAKRTPMENYLRNIYNGWEKVEEALKGIDRNRDAQRNINNLKCAEDTTLMEENEEELKSILMRVKEKSGKAGLNSAIKKLRSWHPVPSLHGKEMGEKWKW